MLKFNKLTLADIPETVQMMRDFYAIDGYDMDVETTKTNFELFIANDKLGQCWLMKEQDQLLGYLIIVYFFSFEFKGTVALLDELYLHANARGKGVGKMAVQFIQDYANDEGIKLIFLEVEDHNEAAKNLYSKQGFEFHPRKLMRFRIDK